MTQSANTANPAKIAKQLMAVTEDMAEAKKAILVVKEVTNVAPPARLNVQATRLARAYKTRSASV